MDEGSETQPEKQEEAASKTRPAEAEATALLKEEEKSADEIWSRPEYVTICQHLHNGNEKTNCAMAFRDATGKKYVKAKNKTAEDLISWGWSTIAGKAKANLAFAPYSQNANKESRWGAMDFDAHDGNTERAARFATKAFRLLLGEKDIFIILESTGSGGYHIWTISEEFRPIAEWSRFLKRTAQIIGATIASGVCEIFPSENGGGQHGMAMRAPGSWNPGSESFSKILWENCKPLIERLSGKSKNGVLPSKDLQKHFPDIERNNSFSSSLYTEGSLYREKEWLEEFAIKEVSTRNHKLSKLVGEVFHQIGRPAALYLSKEQFTRRTVATNATLEDHITSFQELWRGLDEEWRGRLSEKEKRLRGQLETENELDAFRIIRSYAIKAKSDAAPDFPIARDNLGKRLGITGKGAAWIRDKFARLQIIAKTANCVPNKRAARYKWLLPGEARSQDDSRPRVSES